MAIKQAGNRTLLLAGSACAGVLGLVTLIFIVAGPQKRAAPPLLEVLIHDASAPSLSRDGKLVAYVSAVGGDAPHIWVRPTAGGEALQVTKGISRDARPDLSPDGRQMVFASELNGGGVYLVSSFSADPKLILPRGYWATFSPGGQKTLCLKEDGRLIVLDRNGEGPVAVGQVTGNFKVITEPLWSANGRQILFFGRHNDETYKSDRWWLTSLAGSAQPKAVSIPALAPAARRGRRVHVWTQDKRGSGWILYSLQEADTWRLFRVPVTEEGVSNGDAEQLASGGGRIGRVLAAADGRSIVYTTTVTSEQLFETPIRPTGEKAGPTTLLPLTGDASYFSPSVSHDGRYLTYGMASSGRRSIVLRDLLTGVNRTVEDERQLDGAPIPSISPDGTSVVFNRRCYCEIDIQDCAAFMVSTGGGDVRQITANGTPRGFSSDGSVVLLQRYEPNRAEDKIVAVDLATKQEQIFLEDATHPLYHAYFSWDNRWVVFKRLLGIAGAQILMARVTNGKAASSKEWIAVTDGRAQDDKPQTSPDGNTVYFTSDRDGYLCVWMQRLDPSTKHPIGAPIALEHFHNSMGRDAAVHPDGSDLVVARDKVVINLPRRQDDIWSMQFN